MRYEAVIGMEVHAQLLTESKMFCRCSARVFGAEPNTSVCPVCMGYPGTLPTINRRAVEFTVMTGLALNCQIASFSRFARKNYTYPDLPKGYQISQYELPLCSNGWVEIRVNGQQRRIRIRRAHLEEDTAKLFHVNGSSLIDFNRSGVPLLEIVTEPDIRSPEEAYQYLLTLRTILRYLGVSSGDMEKGAMRCEANVSLRPEGSDELGTRVEIKNLNSFRSVKLALEYEIERQRSILESGGTVEQVTMGWDEGRQVTVVQRSKEYAHDYRYFPEPDLPPLELGEEWIAEVRARMPELPEAKRERFMREYGLRPDEADVLVGDREVADYFESCVAVAAGIEPRKVGHWISGELFALLGESGLSISDQPVTPAGLAELLALIQKGTINNNTGKRVLATMFRTGKPAAQIVEEEGLAQIGDEEALEAEVDRVLAENPDLVEQYRAGKKTLIGYFVGQVMKATRGKANPQIVRSLLEKRLEG